MKLQTISQVSRDYGISARMLRYYEQAGLIKSNRKEDYAYRVYDETAISRLRQVIVLRKLRVPVKQIASILNNANAAEAVEIFRQNISELDEEITALSTVKSILIRFVEELREKANIDLNLLNNESMFSAINTLSFPNNQIKENKEDLSMGELNKASENLDKTQDKDVRIVYLPPMTVAAAYALGEGCEGKALEMINRFVKESGLLKIKPDARSFGFDCSKGAVVTGEITQAYEVWVSVPDDMEIPMPLIRREFCGGLYAAHVLRNWDFDDWRKLGEWVNTSDKYENDWGSPRWESPETVFGQGFEETLNFYNYAQSGEMKDLQLDLLFPIKEKKSTKGKNMSSLEIINPYKKCPVLETEHFLLRLVQMEDADDLLKCYSDIKAQPLFNTDNCFGDFCMYKIEDMQNCLAAWATAYEQEEYVRFAIVDKSSGKAIGTIEIFGTIGAYKAPEGVLRLDICSEYERQQFLKELFTLCVKEFFPLFQTERIITKAIPLALERLKAISQLGFRPYRTQDREHLWVIEKP